MNAGAPEPRDVMVLHPSTLKSIAMALASAVTAVLCFRFWFEGLEYGWVAGGFLAAGAIFYAMHAVPTAYALTLSREGFELLELYAVKRYPWSEVTEFATHRGMLGAAVQFHHQPPGASLPRRIKMDESFGLTPPKMVALMNEWRARAAATGASKNIWRSGAGK